MLFSAAVSSGEQGEARSVFRRFPDGRRLSHPGQQGLQTLRLQIRPAPANRNVAVTSQSHSISKTLTLILQFGKQLVYKKPHSVFLAKKN